MFRGWKGAIMSHRSCNLLSPDVENLAVAGGVRGFTNGSAHEAASGAAPVSVKTAVEHISAFATLPELGA